MKKIILGIDPGTKITGYGLIQVLENQIELLDFGSIKPPSTFLLSEKYHAIFEGIQRIIEKHKPTELAIETQFVKNNVQIALKLGMARGAGIVAAKQKGLKIFEYAPTKIKLAITGKGFASKPMVQGMIQRLFLLPRPPEPEDAADALACAICHAHSSLLTMKEV